jgi:pantetheine-phosphate adenylyltransferase
VRTAVYPGSFDPITNGHLDIIKRASKIFDRVIVAVLINSSKKPMFTTGERKELIEEVVSDIENVEVHDFDGLLVDYLKSNGYNIIVKGLRAVSDFESEFQMASMNRVLYEDIETVFIMTATDYSYLSSSMVKEIFAFGGNIEKFAPGPVVDKMRRKLDERRD